MCHPALKGDSVKFRRLRTFCRQDAGGKGLRREVPRGGQVFQELLLLPGIQAGPGENEREFPDLRGKGWSLQGFVNVFLEPSLAVIEQRKDGMGGIQLPEGLEGIPCGGALIVAEKMVDACKQILLLLNETFFIKDFTRRS